MVPLVLVLVLLFGGEALPLVCSLASIRKRTVHPGLVLACCSF
jgi:hypothetical protein